MKYKFSKRVDQTVYVTNTGKNQPVRVFIVVVVYFQNHTSYSHTTINQKFIHQTPSFSATALSNQHQKLQSVGSTWTQPSLLCLGGALHQVLGYIRDSPSFPSLFMALQTQGSQRLRFTAHSPTTIYTQQPFGKNSK